MPNIETITDMILLGASAGMPQDRKKAHSGGNRL